MLLWLLGALLAPAGDLADAMAAGDCVTVLAAAPEPRWTVPRGLCLLEAGDPAAAAALLEGPIEGPLDPYRRLVLGRARLALSEPDRAAAALEDLVLPGAAGVEVRTALARLAVQRVDRPGFEAARKGLDDPELRFLDGALAMAEGRADRALELWRALYAAGEVGGWDARAAERIAQAGGSVADLDDLKRMARLQKHGRVEEAADLASALAAGQGHRTYARVFMAARRYDEALASWAAVLGAPDAAKGPAQDLFDYALTHARGGDYQTAAVVYRRVIAQYPTDPVADFASYKLGYMSYDANACTEAIERFDAHLQRYPASKYLDDALWFSARCHWRAGRTEAAVSAWGRLARERPKSSLVPGAAYWQARALGLSGDAAGEKKALEGVLSRWPTSGYAWFAAQRLGRSFREHPAASRPPWPATWALRPEVVRAEALLEVGLRDWARAELAPIRGAFQGREAALAGAWAFVAAGDYRAGRDLASPHCASPWKGGDPVAQQACTPRPEAGIVSATAARFELDPLLPYGIMTAESALDPGVTSPAGARGLMQLMPAEGPRIHEVLYPGRPYHPDDLYSAPYNASMGTAELGLKRQALKGVLRGTDLPAVIASYNGGEEAVRRWVEASDAPPEFDEFAEDISYTETRNYVKRVLGFVMAYRWVYGDPQ